MVPLLLQPSNWRAAIAGSAAEYHDAVWHVPWPVLYVSQVHARVLLVTATCLCAALLYIAVAMLLAARWAGLAEGPCQGLASPAARRPAAEQQRYYDGGC